MTFLPAIVELGLYAAQAQAERDQRLAAERELKKIQTRVKGGVCPCCNRSFVQLTRHMKTKHPDYEPISGALPPDAEG